MDELVEVVVGTVGRAHGIRGEVAIDLRTDEPGRRFFPGATLTLSSGRSVTVGTVSWQRGRLFVTLEGHADRTAVEKLRGEVLTVRVQASEVPSEDEEYFDRQLVGLEVRDHTGAVRGTVSDVLHMPSQDVLEVETPTGTRLVPFVTALVPTIDMATRHLQLAPVEGLLEDIE